MCLRRLVQWCDENPDEPLSIELLGLLPAALESPTRVAVALFATTRCDTLWFCQGYLAIRAATSWFVFAPSCCTDSTAGFVVPVTCCQGAAKHCSRWAMVPVWCCCVFWGLASHPVSQGLANHPTEA